MMDPYDVRKQKGDFGEAFEKICVGRTEEKRQRWKQALTNVANIFGQCSAKWDNEAEMIEKIVAEVLEELNCIPSKDFEDMVGLDAHVTKLKSVLSLDSNEVKMIGIWGPKGIGKTTIARALYNQLSSFNDDFQLNIFMENIKGSYRRNEINGYSLKLHLQEIFLSEIFNHRNVKISHLGVAQERLKNQKTLIVLDDVDELEQLHALADETQWFGNGTRIIVTTEDKQLLKAHGIKHVYEVGFPSKEAMYMEEEVQGIAAAYVDEHELQIGIETRETEKIDDKEEKEKDNNNQAEEEPTWLDSGSQFVLDSQQLVEALSLCDDLLLMGSQNREENTNNGGSRNKQPCFADYAHLGTEDFKRDLEECQKIVLDPGLVLIVNK